MLLTFIRTAGVALALNLSTAALSQSPAPPAPDSPPQGYTVPGVTEEPQPHSPPVAYPVAPPSAYGPPAPLPPSTGYPSVPPTPYPKPGLSYPTIQPTGNIYVPAIPPAPIGPPSVYPTVYTLPQSPERSAEMTLAPAPGVPQDEKFFNAHPGSCTLEISVGSMKVIQLDSPMEKHKIWDSSLLDIAAVKDILSPQQNPEMAPYLIIHGKEVGVTAALLIDENQRQYDITIIVQPDTRELRHYLKKLYPEANLELTVMKSAVIVRGTVNSDEQSRQIHEIAQLYFPQVFNQITVRHPLPAYTLPSAPIQPTSWNAPAPGIQYSDAPAEVPCTLPMWQPQPAAPGAPQRATIGIILRAEKARLQAGIPCFGAGGLCLTAPPAPAAPTAPVATPPQICIRTYPVADLVIPVPKHVQARIGIAPCQDNACPISKEAEQSCPEQSCPKCPTATCPENSAGPSISTKQECPAECQKEPCCPEKGACPTISTKQECPAECEKEKCCPKKGECPSISTKQECPAECQKELCCPEKGACPTISTKQECPAECQKEACCPKCKDGQCSPECENEKCCPAEKPASPQLEALIHKIQGQVEPGFWLTPGTPGKIIAQEQTLSLVICASPAIHDQIAECLKQMRQEQDVQVSLEIRNYLLTEELWKQLDLQPEPHTGAIRLSSREMKLLSMLTQQDQNSTLYSAPKLTMLQGQAASLAIGDVTNPGQSHSSLWIANVSPDRRVVHLNYAMDEGGIVKTFSQMNNVSIADQETLVLPCSATETRSADIVEASPIAQKVPYVNRLFKNTGTLVEYRKITMVTPRVIVPREEEVQLQTPIKFMGGTIRLMGGQQ